MKRKLNFVLSALLLSALCLFLANIFAPRLSAQTTYGSVAGTVADASGGAIADAQVTLTNVDTAEKREQQSGTDGLYCPAVTASTLKKRGLSVSHVRKSSSRSDKSFVSIWHCKLVR